jgi:hypothetical protein
MIMHCPQNIALATKQKACKPQKKKECHYLKENFSKTLQQTLTFFYM